MQQVFGKKVKMSLPKSYHSAEAKKEKVLVFKGVSNNITLEDLKSCLILIKSPMPRLKE